MLELDAQVLTRDLLVVDLNAQVALSRDLFTCARASFTPSDGQRSHARERPARARVGRSRSVEGELQMRLHVDMAPAPPPPVGRLRAIDGSSPAPAVIVWAPMTASRHRAIEAARLQRHARAADGAPDFELLQRGDSSPGPDGARFER